MTDNNEATVEEVTSGVDLIQVRSNTDLRPAEKRGRPESDQEINPPELTLNPLGINGRLGRPIST